MLNETVIAKFLGNEFERLKRKSPLLEAVVENFGMQVSNPFHLSLLVKSYKKKLGAELENTKLKEMDEKVQNFNANVKSLIKNFEKSGEDRVHLDRILKGFEAEFNGFHRIRSESRKWVETQRINSTKLELKKGIEFEDLVKDISRINSKEMDIEKVDSLVEVDEEPKRSEAEEEAELGKREFNLEDIEELQEGPVVLDKSNLIPKMLDEIDRGNQFSPPRRIESEVVDLDGNSQELKKVFMPKLNNPKENGWAIDLALSDDIEESEGGASLVRGEKREVGVVEESYQELIRKKNLMKLKKGGKKKLKMAFL
jgi:hypothetical protein